MSAVGQGQGTQDRRARFGRRLISVGLLPIIIVVIFLAFGLIEPKFFRTANLLNVLDGTMSEEEFTLDADNALKVAEMCGETLPQFRDVDDVCHDRASPRSSARHL